MTKKMSRNLPPKFSSGSFVVSGLTFKSLIHSEFICEYGFRETSPILLLVAALFSQQCLLDGPFPIVCSYIHGCKLTGHVSVGLLLALCSVSLTSVPKVASTAL